MKYRTFFLACILGGALPMPGAAFFGLVDTIDGQQFAGHITFVADGVTIRVNEDQEHPVPLDQLIRVQAVDEDSFPRTSQDAGEARGVWGAYFRNRNLEGESQSRVDPAIQFDWKNGSPLGGYPPDQFSVRWESLLEAPVTGLYTFTTKTDDGVRLRVDNKTLIDQWRDQSVTEADGQIQLEEGRRYELVMEFYENSGEATAILQWSHPGQTKSIVPADRFFLTEKHRASQAEDTPGSPRGVLGLYYNTPDFSGPFLVATNSTIHFNWPDSPAPGINPDQFSVRWLGRIHPDRTDDYTFHVESDDGVRLYVAGKKVLDHWHDGAFKPSTEPIRLEGGKDYTLHYAMYDQSGPAVARLSWSSPSLPRVILPREYLSPMPAPEVKADDMIQIRGVYLTDGSIVHRRIQSTDGSSLKFSNSKQDPVLALVHVARIHFQDVKLSLVRDLPSGLSGLLLESGDFLEGDIRAIKGNSIQISSILLGLKSYGMDKILAAVFREVKGRPALFALETKDLSRFLVDRWKVTDQALVLQDVALAGFKIPAREIARLERLAPPR